ncbi:MAG: phosphopantetheine-binding protein [Vicinamibacterales bacterium]
MRLQAGRIPAVLRARRSDADGDGRARRTNPEPNPEHEPGTRNLEPGTSRLLQQLVDELRDHLAAHLPAYMVPRSIVRLDALPLTANGKVDRRALPVPERATPARPVSGEAYRAPETGVERRIAAIWQDLLDVDRVGLDDSFLLLGGYSLLAIQLIARLRQELDVQVPNRAVFERPTLEALAAFVVEQQAVSASTADVEAILAEIESLSIEEARARLTLPD